VTDTNPDHAKWQYEQNMRAAERAHDNDEKNWHLANEAAIGIGNIALRTAVLINGGAAIAVLTFTGGLVNSGKLALGPQLTQVTAPLIWFAVGVAIATFAMGLGYVVNYSNAGIISSRDRTYISPYFKETDTTKRWRKSSTTCTILALASAAISLALFVWGMLEVRNAITLLH
jgi:hypothetical protein